MEDVCWDSVSQNNQPDFPRVSSSLRECLDSQGSMGCCPGGLVVRVPAGLFSVVGLNPPGGVRCVLSDSNVSISFIHACVLLYTCISLPGYLGSPLIRGSACWAMSGADCGLKQW